MLIIRKYRKIQLRNWALVFCYFKYWIINKKELEQRHCAVTVLSDANMEE